MSEKIKIGISACLIGERVRYDGGHKLDPLIADTLGTYFDFVPVCPEAEAGLGVPREPMQLMDGPDSPRLVTLETRMDHTARLLDWMAKRLPELEKEDLRGFILKARSPSCGLTVQVFRADGQPAGMGAGLFARAFMERFPAVPVTDEEDMHDPGLRESFIERVSAYAK